MFHSLQKQSVADEAAEGIIEMIRSRQYASGDKLPGERQMSKQLAVGRTSIREAIRRLETMGLLEVRQGLGTFVKDSDSRILQSSLQIDEQKLNDYFEARKIIETAAAALAAVRADAQQIAEIRRWAQLVEVHIARGDAQGIVTTDIEFHRQIVIATGNAALIQLMENLVQRDMRIDSTHIPELLPEIIKSHRAILIAIEAGDGQAANQEMKEHLATVGDKLTTFWQRREALLAGEKP